MLPRMRLTGPSPVSHPVYERARRHSTSPWEIRWTLRYDEFVFVLAGGMTVQSGATSVPVRPGQGWLPRHGTTVTYRGAPGTRALYILHPIDWETRDSPPGS